MARTELKRGAELARSAGDDWALVQAKQVMSLTYLFQSEHAQAALANDEVAPLAERLGEPYQVARRWFFVGWTAHLDGRLAQARDAVERMWVALDGVGEPVVEAWADTGLALIEVWQGEPEPALRRLQAQLERALRLGAGMVVPMLIVATAFGELAAGRFEQARGRLEGLVAIVEGRHAFTASWALGLLAEARRLLDDDAAESTAREAQAIGEQIDNRHLATRARLTLGRLAAARGDWTVADQHALAHLDACVEGGHATYLPACLDALAEIAAGLPAHDDAVRPFAAAERARTEIGVVRVPAEEKHWTAIDARLREALGDEAYETARTQGVELSTDDALEWARRGRGPRQRPSTGWESLTPTEAKVAELVAQGLTNPQVGERLDIHGRAELTAQLVRRDSNG